MTNYNTQNLGQNIVPVGGAVDSAGYLAIQAGVAANEYPSVSNAGTTIENTVLSQITLAQVQFGSALRNTDPHYTVTATNTAPAADYIYLSSVVAGSPTASLQYQVPNADYVTAQYGLNTLASGQNTYLAYVSSGKFVVKQLGSAYMTVAQLGDFFTTYASDITSGAWNTSSFWQNSTDPAIQQFYKYFTMLYDDIHGSAPGTAAAAGVIPPTSVLDFFTKYIQAATIYTPATSSINPSIYDGVSTSNSAADTAFGLSGGQYTNILPLGNFSIAYPTVNSANTQSLLDVFNQNYFTPSNFSSTTTSTDVIQNYLKAVTSPSNAIVNAFEKYAGQTIPFTMVAEGTGDVTSIGTYTVPSSNQVLADLFNAQNITLANLTTAQQSSMITSYTSAISNAFLQAFDSSGAASNPVLKAEGEKALFNNTFSAFMDAVSTGEIQVTGLQDLLNKWSLFVGPSVTLGQSAILSYQQIYRTFFPDATQTDFLNLLNTFISQFTHSSSGVFNSSLMADQWYTTVQASYLVANGQSTGSQPLLLSNFSETKVILELYSLLINVLGDIQRLTASQASYDNFLVKMEAAYTRSIAGIPDDLIGNTIPGGVDLSTGVNTTQLSVQSSLESQLSNATQKWISNLTAFNTEVSNQEKAQTTTISQSNEAANQQANLINSILQELQSLLQSIWK